MIKNNKWNLLLSSIIILLPAFMGVFFWNTPAVLILSLIVLAIHWICILITAKDPKNDGQNQKVFRLVIWICPLISIFANFITYAAVFKKTDGLAAFTFLLLGLLFVAIGNYLPKCKQNFTIGIKVKWALANEENWNATHRFGGRIWVIGGLLLMLCCFLPESLFPWVMFIAIFVLAFIPAIYSYLYYRKQVKAGTAPEKVVIPMDKTTKRFSIVGCVVGVVILIGALIMVFTGEINLTYEDNSFTVEATYWNAMTIDYASVDSIEYRDDFDAGSRIYGYSGARLLLGTFENEEFGSYTLYSYTPCDTCVLLEMEGKIVAIGGEDETATKTIYEELLLHIQ